MKRQFILRNAEVREAAAAYVSSLPVGDDKPLEVVVGPYKRRRSLAQNNCLHGWCQAIADAHELSHGERLPPEAWKEFFKRLFLGEHSCEIGGKIITTTRHTASLSVAEFQELLEAIERWAAEHLHIALPHGPDYEEAFTCQS